VESLDRHLKWRVVSIALFVLSIVALATIALWSLLPHAPTTGVPDDPRVAAAQALAARSARLVLGPYRFTSEFLGAEAASRTPAPDSAALAEAERGLRAARWRRPFDPRIPAAIASLDLARGRLRHAEVGFRHACDIARHYPNAHVGLGVTLALEADHTSDPFAARGYRLRAVAQFRAVDPSYPDAVDALYDLAWVLRQLGEHAAARAAAEQYVKRVPGDPAGARLLEAAAAR
jgi:tetratricopeptide (TPR) repeat protein